MSKLRAAADQITSVSGGTKMQIVLNESDARRERDRTRRAHDRALRLEVEQRTARVRRLQMIVGRALVEAGLAEEFEAAMRR